MKIVSRIILYKPNQTPVSQARPTVQSKSFLTSRNINVAKVPQRSLTTPAMTILRSSDLHPNLKFTRRCSTDAKTQNLDEEAQKRDHRVLGRAQELFMMDPLSPGNVFFLPHGTRIVNKLQSFIREEYRKRGFDEVITPLLFNNELWKKSGHWENYKDDMFVVTGASLKKTESGEEAKLEYMLKPMNCPGHCLMYAHKQRSYRELPIRIADFGVLHRNEGSGSLTGLTRLRKFVQDDAHIFCTPDQVRDEMRGCLDFIKHVYGVFGFEFELELSTRPEKYLGELSTWEHAESQMREVLDEFGKEWKVNPGDGAFYGPKIDIHILDALKRRHQCATMQLDFQLPQRFNLEFINETNEQKTPVMIHRAVLGSIERMMGILIEHTGGKWPLWLSPRQCAVLPVSDKSIEYAQRVCKSLHDAGFYTDVDVSDKKLQKKIRDSQLAQYNYILVVGEQESKNNTVNVRTRDGVVHGTTSVEKLISDLNEAVKNKK